MSLHSYKELILAIDTSTDSIGVGLGTEREMLASRVIGSSAKPEHLEKLVPTIETLFKDAGVRSSDTTLVAVVVGPGMFSGLRVGIATGKSLAQAWNIQMVPLNSLESLATASRSKGTIAAIKARRNEIYWAAFEQDALRITEDSVESPDSLLSWVRESKQQWNLIGNAAEKFPQLQHKSDLQIVEGCSSPEPKVMLDMALQNFQSVASVPWQEISPIYLREPDAVAQGEITN